MPYVNIVLTEEKGGATKEQKEAIIKGVTKTLVDVLGRGEKTTVVTINELSTDNYGIGGEQVTEIRKRG